MPAFQLASPKVKLNKGVAGAAIATGSSFISASLIVVKPLIRTEDARFYIKKPAQKDEPSIKKHNRKYLPFQRGITRYFLLHKRLIIKVRPKNQRSKHLLKKFFMIL
ncbi:MAG: hypothetical protein ATN31_04805 [Candidatus Epulonipiscioides saccharophilum]|nr:MAG: hypothetical protein ATN31_04805 [Epulopiscium sp. AS2M-Bin001]